jgi:hypothetical protein
VCDDQAPLTGSFLESDKKDGSAPANDDFVAIEMHLETTPRPMRNGHDKTPQNPGPVYPALVGRS